LPYGIVESSQIGPIFTPSTKAKDGQHDENINIDQMMQILRGEFPMHDPVMLASKLEEKTLNYLSRAHKYAYVRGIIIADTKFEFGVLEDGEIELVDEILTPDSSRFWPREKFAIGRSQESFDKQPVRDETAASGWNKKPPGPALSAETVRKTIERYRQAQRMLFG
jgi:phosphoribosylaminoimidazole-succinocarboxamide synthase